MNEKTNNTIILITETYPFGAVAESFLDKEIPYLSKSFDSVIVVPCHYPQEIERIERKLPDNVSIDISLLNYMLSIQSKKYFLIFNLVPYSILFFNEISRKPKKIFNLRALKKAIYSLYIAILIKKWVFKFIKERKINLERVIFYTYWLNAATLALILTKKKYPQLKLVSRAHGGDLYEERYSPPYIPFQEQTLNKLNHIYFISNHGKNYLINKYPDIRKKSSVTRLGVYSPNFTTKFSQDGIFRIVSCSYIVPVKRIHLIISALKELGLQRPELKIGWTHIGYGPLFEEIKNHAITALPKNIHCKFLGFLPNHEVFNYYKNNPIDVFINVSSSEGLPVSIMEAQSCGIPVIATKVGGIPEIVTEKVGILLNENPSPEEIAKAMEFFIDHPEITQQMRLNSLENWENNFNAEKNFSEFAKKLKSL